MTTYQSLNDYQGGLYGKPQYFGLEYDESVPDNTIIASPGGSSSTYHHYTKGFYGIGGSSSDLYAGEGRRYPYAEYGNLYQVGQTGGQESYIYPPVPDPRYTANQSSTPIRDGFEFETRREKYGGAGHRGPHRQHPHPHHERFESSQDMEFIPKNPEIEPFTVTTNFSKEGLNAHVKFDINVVGLFFLLLLIFIAFTFWTNAGSMLITTYVTKRPLTWKSAGIVAIVITLLIFILVWTFKIPTVQ
jgi:hypothetical protein